VRNRIEDIAHLSSVLCVVVFDLDKVEDRATYVKPCQPSAGMVHVLVNGTPVIDTGKLIEDARPGRPVRRPVAA
jgi:N-acyl-D-glutamate deacylase